jgi:hypothetical protein
MCSSHIVEGCSLIQNEKLKIMYSLCPVMFAAAKRNLVLRWVVWRAAEK